MNPQNPQNLHTGLTRTTHPFTLLSFSSMKTLRTEGHTSMSLVSLRLQRLMVCWTVIPPGEPPWRP